MNKKVTIQDIADELGLSRNTVSKAINNSEGISDATRDKILKKAIEMGYKHFSYVDSIANIRGKKDTDTGSTLATEANTVEYQGEIALLTSLFLNSSHFASLMMDKFQQEISQMGYTVNTHRVTKKDLQNKTLPVTLNKDNVKAFLCIEMFDWEYDQMLCDMGIPILFVDGPSRVDGRILPADQLYMDNQTEISRFVNKALDQGLTRIGFAGDITHCQSFYERYTAFFTAMVMRGYIPEDRFILNYQDKDDLRWMVKELEDMPDIFICANDFSALDLIEDLREFDIPIPEKVRVFAFDDSSESRMCRPAISTVHIHTQVMAYSAMQLLLSRIASPNLDYRTVYTQTDAIYRESTGDIKQ